jgi:hypothetical protein
VAGDSAELVVVAPYWAEPLARSALPAQLMPVRHVARPDVSGYEQAIEVSILGQEAAELEGWQTVEQRSLGAFRLRLRKNPNPARIRFDFVEGLDPERVEVTDGSGRTCRWNPRARRSTGGLHGHIAFPGKRFDCGGGAVFFVGSTVVDDEHYRPRRCVWAHPSRYGPLRILYRQVPLGTVVRGYGALSWFLMRDGEGTPIELSVSVAGEQIGTFVHHDQQGFSPFEFPTGRHAGTVADVEFVVSSQSPKNRHFCLYADSR